VAPSDAISRERWLTRRPRSAAALAFGLAGLVLPAAWFLPATLHGRNPIYQTLLFVGVPGVAAAIAGAVLGHRIIGRTSVSSAGRAALLGAAVATLALVFFSVLFATALALTEPGNGSWNILGVTALLLEGSALAAWLPSAALGAGVGWALFRLRRERAQESGVRP
jgi:hypothetical protein